MHSDILCSSVPFLLLKMLIKDAVTKKNAYQVLLLNEFHHLYFENSDLYSKFQNLEWKLHERLLVLSFCCCSQLFPQASAMELDICGSTNTC